MFQWFREDNNARNGSREKKPRKAKTEMGERHHGYVRYDDSGKQSGRGPETILHLGSDVLTRILNRNTFDLLPVSLQHGVSLIYF